MITYKFLKDHFGCNIDNGLKVLWERGNAVSRKTSKETVKVVKVSGN